MHFSAALLLHCRWNRRTEAAVHAELRQQALEALDEIAGHGESMELLVRAGESGRQQTCLGHSLTAVFIWPLQVW